MLVNNAGGTMPRPAMATSERFFETALRFNVTAAFLLTQRAARAMVDTAGSGSVVNISSRSSDMVQTSFVAYGAGKAALNMMTRNMAADLAPRVRINAIAVGGVATQALDVVLTDDDLRAQFVAGTPMRATRRARGHRVRGAVPRVGCVELGDGQDLPGRRRRRSTGHLRACPTAGMSA